MAHPEAAADAIPAKRRSEDFSAELAKTGWYHSMELPSGVIHGFLSLDDLRHRWSEFPLPHDLTATRLLDIGTWDGWFAFEAERRGAEVVAVDNVEQENFHYAHRELKSKARYEVCEIYRLPERKLGAFDYTLFLGVLYHLRHPLRALEIVCGLTKQLAIVDSFIVDDEGANATPIPWMEFYEHTELANQVDNWVGPTLPCLLALCRSAGFARVEYLGTKHHHARIACYRHWEPPPEHPATAAPVLTSVTNARHGDRGINFDSRSEEIVDCWFTSSDDALQREDLRVEIGGFGVHAISFHRGVEEAHAAFILPPGLAPGWHDVRLRTTRSHSSESQNTRIAVDIPVNVTEIAVLGAADGMNWRPGAVELGAGGHLALWIEGLAENADRNNVRVYRNQRRLSVESVSHVSASDSIGIGQVNVRVPTDVGRGPCRLEVRHGNARAEISVEAY
jgi:tRNA (mo5U34)-methyltransferase